MRDHIDVAIAQFSPRALERDTNVALMAGIIEREAAAAPTDLVVFPELATTGYVPPRYDPAFHRALRTQSDQLGGPAGDAIGRAARAAGVHVVYGFSEQPGSGALYNSVALVSPDGAAPRVQRKTHLWREEWHYFTPGAEIRVADSELARIGLSVCYDSRFPEVCRVQSVLGAELLVCVFALVSRPGSPSTLLTRASTRAMENNAFFIAANRRGVDSAGIFRGGSGVAAPSGEIIASDPDGTAEVVRARLDGGAITTARDYADVRRHRRPELYRALGAPGA
ncbi:carbon-nitrogen hydrolase family protein [Nonomuraea sp. B5E05]|uniref:carbon-nitrogen hydrolase family protein n=1 Tax=Nonomuraea sp. B5E05 TaxID=3153569 RepID=UPI0032600506